MAGGGAFLGPEVREARLELGEGPAEVAGDVGAAKGDLAPEVRAALVKAAAREASARLNAAKARKRAARQVAE